MAINKIVVLTGAGISAESGLGTFRDEDGIWTRYPLEDLATPEGFARNPDFVHGFYNDRRAALKSAQPHAGHKALAELERSWCAAGRSLTLITQNVDNLHEQAGTSSDRLIHMHGELLQVRCGRCSVVQVWSEALSTATICPACEQAGAMRPNVVWFGEMPLEMDRIEADLVACDLFVSIGTSGNVYPAAGFCQMARAVGAHTVELNLEPSEMASAFDAAIYGPASEIVPTWVAQILSDHAT